MDGSLPHNTTAATRKRRSSILKTQRPPRTPFSELEFTVTTPTETTKSRRVSFSRRTGVAEFVTNEATTTWKNFYEEQNKSHESSGHDSMANPPRNSLGHIGNRMFEQQFQEVEAEIDFVGTLNLPNSNNLNQSLGVNLTEQIALLDATADKTVTAPKNQLNLSGFTENQSKIFKADISNSEVREATNNFSINFSTLQPVSDKDDLDEIERDLKMSRPSVVGPSFGRNTSQYIEFDLNSTRGPLRDINGSDMSITDTIHSPKKEVSNSFHEVKKNAIKDSVVDKENIIVNPYITPAETDNFAINSVSEKVLVFDGKKLKYADINADIDEIIPEKPINKLRPVSFQNTEIIVQNSTINMSMTNVVPTRKRQTIVFDTDDINADISMTQCVANPVTTNKTLGLSEDFMADMSVTQAIPNRIISESHNETQKSKITEGLDDMSFTKAIGLDDLPDLKTSPKPKRQTIVFDENYGDISVTQCVYNAIISNEPSNKDFDVETSNMSITQAVPALNADAVSTTEEETAMELPEQSSKDKNAGFDMSITNIVPQTKRQTILFDDKVNDISMTQCVAHPIPVNKSILFNDDNANMSVTQVVKNETIGTSLHISRNFEIFKDVKDFDAVVLPSKSNQNKKDNIPSELLKHFENAYKSDSFDMSLTKVISQSKRQTIVFDEKDSQGDISITQCVEQLLSDDKNEDIPIDMSVTQAISSEVLRKSLNMSKFSRKSVLEEENENKDIDNNQPECSTSAYREPIRPAPVQKPLNLSEISQLVDGIETSSSHGIGIDKSRGFSIADIDEIEKAIESSILLNDKKSLILARNSTLNNKTVKDFDIVDESIIQREDSEFLENQILENVKELPKTEIDPSVADSNTSHATLGAQNAEIQFESKITKSIINVIETDDILLNIENNKLLKKVKDLQEIGIDMSATIPKTDVLNETSINKTIHNINEIDVNVYSDNNKILKEAEDLLETDMDISVTFPKTLDVQNEISINKSNHNNENSEYNKTLKDAEKLLKTDMDISVTFPKTLDVQNEISINKSNHNNENSEYNKTLKDAENLLETDMDISVTFPKTLDIIKSIHDTNEINVNEYSENNKILKEAKDLLENDMDISDACSKVLDHGNTPLQNETNNKSQKGILVEKSMIMIDNDDINDNTSVDVKENDKTLIKSNFNLSVSRSMIKDTNIEDYKSIQKELSISEVTKEHLKEDINNSLQATRSENEKFKDLELSLNKDSQELTNQTPMDCKDIFDKSKCIVDKFIRSGDVSELSQEQPIINAIVQDSGSRKSIKEIEIEHSSVLETNCDLPIKENHDEMPKFDQLIKLTKVDKDTVINDVSKDLQSSVIATGESVPIDNKANNLTEDKVSDDEYLNDAPMSKSSNAETLRISLNLSKIINQSVDELENNRILGEITEDVEMDNDYYRDNSMRQYDNVRQTLKFDNYDNFVPKKHTNPLSKCNKSLPINLSTAEEKNKELLHTSLHVISSLTEPIQGHDKSKLTQIANTNKAGRHSKVMAADKSLKFNNFNIRQKRQTSPNRKYSKHKSFDEPMSKSIHFIENNKIIDDLKSNQLYKQRCSLPKTESEEVLESVANITSEMLQNSVMSHMSRKYETIANMSELYDENNMSIDEEIHDVSLSKVDALKTEESPLKKSLPESIAHDERKINQIVKDIDKSFKKAMGFDVLSKEEFEKLLENPMPLDKFDMNSSTKEFKDENSKPVVSIAEKSFQSKLYESIPPTDISSDCNQRHLNDKNNITQELYVEQISTVSSTRQFEAIFEDDFSVVTEKTNTPEHKDIGIQSSPTKILSILRKSFIDTDKTKGTKNNVIPNFDIDDNLKELMNDLVKPTADMITYDTHASSPKSPSTSSLQVQTNIITPSELDFGVEVLTSETNYENMCFNKTINKTETKIEHVEAKNVIMFDHNNPLNNVFIPVDMSNVHKYEPMIMEKEVQNISQESIILIDSDHSETENVKKENKSLVLEPTLDQNQIYILKDTEANTELAMKETNQKDTEVNTELAMKETNQILEENSSLTLVEDDSNDVVAINSLKRNLSPNKKTVRIEEVTPKPLLKMQKRSFTPRSGKKSPSVVRFSMDCEETNSSISPTRQELKEIKDKPKIQKAAKKSSKSTKRSCVTVQHIQNETNENKRISSAGSKTTSDVLSDGSSKKLIESYCKTNVVEKIKNLPFIGNQIEWETSSITLWSFSLLRSKLRLNIHLSDYVGNKSYSIHPDTKIESVNVQYITDEPKSSIWMVASKCGHEILKHLTAKCVYAQDVVDTLRSCNNQMLLLIKWVKAMKDARLRLAYSISGDIITLKVANIPLSSVWQAQFRIHMCVSNPHTQPWPKASLVNINKICSDILPSIEHLEKITANIKRDWGHVPNFIWKVFRYLKCKSREEDLFVV